MWVHLLLYSTNTMMTATVTAATISSNTVMTPIAGPTASSLPANEIIRIT